MKPLIALISLLALTGCLFQSPAEECLSSFKEILKDPDSGRVVSFSDGLLMYTATNSYGARIQGKAICVEIQGKWLRDRSKELSSVNEIFILKLDKHSEVLAKLINCRAQGGTTESCGGNLLPNETPEESVERLRKESIAESGFN